jgi:hypothetical protein
MKLMHKRDLKGFHKIPQRLKSSREPKGAWSIVVAAFPGTGKTHFADQNEYTAIDLDSSGFSNIGFPINYVEQIEESIGKANFILTSTHASVRTELTIRKIPYALIYPDHRLRDEYLYRCHQRGSSLSFLRELSTNWSKYIRECEKQKDCLPICLSRGQYLSDAIDWMTEQPFI